jgi:hypothetical protein
MPLGHEIDRRSGQIVGIQAVPDGSHHGAAIDLLQKYGEFLLTRM